MMWELGDSMAGSGGAGGDYDPGGLRDGQPRFHGTARAAGRAPSHREAPGLPLEKSLCLIPELFRFALVYGFNPLTGRTTPRWRARNVVRWARPNPVAGSLGRRNVECRTGDARYRPATTELVVACRGTGRYFDLDAVRNAPKHGVALPGRAAPVYREVPGQPDRRTNRLGDGGRINSHPAGTPPLDHWWHDDDWYDQDTWLISTRPYKGAHYATMPVDLPVIPIRSMCPERVCTRCGQPSERITERTRRARGRQSPYQIARKPGRWAENTPGVGTSVDTLGWSECGCGSGCDPTTWRHEQQAETDEAGQLTGKLTTVRRVEHLGVCRDAGHWRPGVVLDPFGGAGTTAVAAQRLGRDCILVELNERNAELVHRRITHDLAMPADVAVAPRAQLDLFADGT